MPRKAVKPEAASASRSSSKRPVPPTPSRQSKRARMTARQTYAEPNSDTDDASGGRKNADDSDNDVASSNYEDHSEKAQSSESEPDASASESDAQATPRGRPAKSTKQTDEKELWKSGAKLAPGTQIIIKKPKARDAGDTPYTDGTIHPNTM